jgi:hypothetical protein
MFGVRLAPHAGQALSSHGFFVHGPSAGSTIYRSATFEKDRADASFEGYLKRELPGSLTIAVVEE